MDKEWIAGALLLLALLGVGACHETDTKAQDTLTCVQWGRDGNGKPVELGTGECKGGAPAQQWVRDPETGKPVRIYEAKDMRNGA